MVKRIALVAWWLGALSGIVGGLATAAVALDSAGIGPLAGALMTPAAAAMCAAPWWALAFVLGGKFWRPPKP